MDNQLITIDGEDVFVEPVCDFFEIDYKKQYLKIKNDAFLGSRVSKKTLESVFGDKRVRFCVDKFGFLVWLAGVNPNIVAEEKREAFRQFQANIYSFFHGSVKENTELKKLYAERESLEKEIAVKKDRIKYIDKRLKEAERKRYKQGELPLDNDEPKQLGSSEDSEAAE